MYNFFLYIRNCFRTTSYTRNVPQPARLPSIESRMLSLFSNHFIIYFIHVLPILARRFHCNETFRSHSLIVPIPNRTIDSLKFHGFRGRDPNLKSFM